MAWKPDVNKPICPQICEHICLEIASGVYKPNERIPSVRELAVTIGVNPNTVQRSYEQLENKGIIYTVRNSGKFVSEDTSIAKDTIKKLIKEKTTEYFVSMKALGLTIEETKNIIKEWNE